MLITRRLSHAVHPHACGADLFVGRLLFRHCGSPPRVWGRRRSPRCARAPGGSPPRVWGRLYFSVTSMPSQPVHPHACGADISNSAPRRVELGSPPRVWGRRQPCPSWCPRCRFTPTRVGQTSLHRPDARRISVHPHACGADAAAASVLPSMTVHPHACGADNLDEFKSMKALGSPPRVWGRPAFGNWESECTRFTPTRVGQTYAKQIDERFTAVHPHACGADFGGDGRQHRDLRFTPTRVGQTLYTLDIIPYRAVHPHACGADTSFTIHSQSVPISAPTPVAPFERWGNKRPAGTPYSL